LSHQRFTQFVKDKKELTQKMRDKKKQKEINKTSETK